MSANRSETLEELQTYRAELSFYEGAPLVIPHEVKALGREDCLGCHAPGSMGNGDRIALPHPHSDWNECLQCHLGRRNTTIFSSSNFSPSDTVSATQAVWQRFR